MLLQQLEENELDEQQSFEQGVMTFGDEELQ